MAVSVAPASSTLNPNAPLFVPAAYLAAEDFSAEWWMLIKTPAFRDYWLRERAHTLVDAQDESFDNIDIQFEHLNVGDETEEFDALDWETDLDAVYSAGQWADHGSEEAMTDALAATALIQALREREERRIIEKEGYHKKPPSCCAADVKQKVKRAGKVQKIQQPRVEVKWAQKRT